MPVYSSYDPSKVSAGFEMLDKDDYEVTVGEPKAFDKKDDSGEVKNYGVRFGLMVAEGQHKGKKPQPQVCYMHNPASEAFSKQFQMAVLGYGKGNAEEKRFDKDQVGKDWSFDTDSGMVGDAWREMTGKRVIIGYDIGVRADNGEPQQKTTGFRPVTG